MSQKPAALFGGFILALVSIFAGTPAFADPDVQSQIDEVLAEFPGGTQTAWNEVSWDNGAVVLTLSVPGEVVAMGVGSCANGYYCAYAGPSYTGSKLTFSGCTAGNSVAALGAPVRSIANSRVFGTVSAYNSSSFLFSVGAGSGTNTGASVTLLSCS
jgi:hypothetical protein